MYHLRDALEPYTGALSRPPKTTSYVLRMFLALAIAALIIGVIQQLTNIDLRLADYFYSQSQHKFLWRSTWFAKDLMHAYLKWLIMLAGLMLACVVLADAIAPWQRINQTLRLRLRFVALASILIPTVISLFKHFSILHCPSGISRYGGHAQYLRLLDQLPVGMQAGHCFPAGHASTGLWLAATCVFYLPNDPKKALKLFYAGVGVGLLMGWVQQMRGEHFLSHTLWSAWLASLIIALMLTFTPELLSKKNVE